MRRWLLRLLFLAAVAGLLLTLVRRRHVGAGRRRGRRGRRSTTRTMPDRAAAVPEEVPPSARWSEPVEGVPDRLPGQGQAGVGHLPRARDVHLRAHGARPLLHHAEAAEADGFRAAKR